MLVPAFSIGFGVFCGMIFKYGTAWSIKELKIDKWLSYSIFILLLGLFFIAPAKASWYTATNQLPIMNDQWHSTLIKINEEGAPDAIVNSWWDYGHWMKYYTDRAVTFDGTSQNTPMAHWVGKALLTDDEHLSVGILRMLDCGSRQGYTELNNIVNEH